MLKIRTAARSGALAGLAGLAGSLCCLGPSVALLLGAGTSSALWGLALGRGPALAVGAALLLAGLGLSLRHARACGLAGHARWRVPLIMLMAFGLSYGLLGGLMPRLAARHTSDEPLALAAPVAAAPRLYRATLLVDKMTCPPCAAKVRHLLARKPYIQHAIAEEGDEQVVIDYDAAQVNVGQLAALFPLSFGVTVVSNTPLP